MSKLVIFLNEIEFFAINIKLFSIESSQLIINRERERLN